MNIFVARGGLWIIIAVILVVAIVAFIIVKSRSKGKTDKRVCPQCGKPVKHGKNFCTSCGAKIE